MIYVSNLPQQQFNCLKQPKNEVKQGNAELFKRILKNEINKLQTDENYK